MFKKLIYTSCILLVLCITSISKADLIAYYPLDGNADDATGNYDGTVEGDLVWTTDSKTGTAASFNGTNTRITADHVPIENSSFTIAMYIKPTGLAGNHTFISEGSGSNGNYLHIRVGGPNAQYGTPTNGIRFSFWDTTGSYDCDTPADTIENDTWYHVAATFDLATLTKKIYIDGVLQGTNSSASAFLDTTNDLVIGAEGTGSRYSGVIDEVKIFDTALSEGEILAVISGQKGLASNSKPTGSKVSIDVGMLSWSPGEYVEAQSGTHNLFFGTDKASVASATVDEHPGLIYFEESMDVNEYAIGRLEYGTTYYWRIDEVNNPASSGEVKGGIWEFTTEPEGIDLAPETIIDVTADSPTLYYPTQEPNMTCNGSGLDANDMHSTDVDNTMWLGLGAVPGDTWIQYEFDQIYKFHEMLVWNYNEPDPGQGFGAKDVNISYSEDGQVWKSLGDLVQLEPADGADGYEANNTVALDGAIGKFIKLELYNCWYDIPGGGLSEVRFSIIPTRAMIPAPEDEAEEIDLGTDLVWKAGRGVVSHTVYIGSDPNEVKAGNADIIADTDESMYSPVLDLAKTYYWKVDEVNDNEEYPIWDGPVWSFSTIESILIDGFEEGYDDSDVNAVYLTWIDGYDAPENGSIMGNVNIPYLSETAHDGDYASPMTYDNITTADYSEIVADTAKLPIATSDWSIGSPKTLSIWFYGDPNNIVGDSELYCQIGGMTATYAGDLEVLTRDLWRRWDIDLDALGADLSNIPEITIGIKTVGSQGGSGVILLDDIMLTGLDPVAASPDIIIEAEDYTTITPPMEVNDVFAGASGGQYIHPLGGTANASNSPPEPNGTATYDVDLTAGQYMIYARVSITGGFQGDAFWVNVEGATADATLHDSGWAQWNTITAGEDWHWVGVWQSVGYGAGPVITWTVPEDGITTIDIAYRDTAGEPKIDALMIVKVGD